MLGSIVKEVCVESFVQAREKVAAGADRIELCDNLAVGGTTPSYGTIKECLKKLSIPVFVMIRPRGGDFVYSLEEIEIIKNDILLCKDMGVSGIVLGVLTADKKIDVPLLRNLVDLASPMEITFHKAIDEVEGIFDALDILMELGVTRVLTSGKGDTAIEGREILNEMIRKSEGKIQVVVAGKVTGENLEEVKKAVPNREYHGKNIV